MSEKKEAQGSFKFDGDTKRFHRFQVTIEAGIVGSLFIPKGNEIPASITLVSFKNEQEVQTQREQ